MINKICGIYTIHNTQNNKQYIGQSTNLQKRFNTHKEKLRKKIHDNKRLQHDWNIYGEQAFQFKLIKQCKKENLNQYEREYIKKYNTTHEDKGYNFLSGGEPTLHDGIKTSKTRTKTGIYRVHKHKDKLVKQGFRWRYSYYDENRQLQMIQSLNLYDLKLKVIKQKLPWIVINTWGKQLIEEEKRTYNPYSNHKSTTGYYRVSTIKNNKYTQGFIYAYNTIQNGRRIKISSVDLNKLKKKVLARGFPWYKIGEAV